MKYHAGLFASQQTVFIFEKIIGPVRFAFAKDLCRHKITMTKIHTLAARAATHNSVYTPFVPLNL